MNRKYWKGIDELVETPQFVESRDQEFPKETSVEEFLGDDNLQESSTGRRDFLKFLGFSVAAATVAACEAPVTKAIPYVNKPENVTPGMATWYASTYYDGNSYSSILVKTREGRPIFVKGNGDHGINHGVTNPRIIASILGLYDSARLTAPQIKNGSGEWESTKFSKIDKKVEKALKGAKRPVIVSNTVISPSMGWAIDELKIALGGVRNPETFAVEGSRLEHIQYDAVSYAGIRAAHKETFGLEQPDGNGIIPSYDFTKAKTVVSVGADFLNSWLIPTKFSCNYAIRRKPEGEWMSRHYQFESMMSVTGSNADYRGMIKPAEQASVIAALLKGLGKDTMGVSTKLNEQAQKVVNLALKDLKKSKGESLVVCGSNNKAVQVLVNKLNHALGAYDHTINVNEPINMYQSHDEAMDKLVKEVISGKGNPDAIVFYGTNPVYSLPNGKKFGEALKNVKHKVSLSMHADETANLCDIIAPDNHYLESWMDYNPIKEHYSICQPTIRPLGNTASAMESMLVWAGQESRGGRDSKVAYNLVKDLWIQFGFPNQTEYADSEEYWNMMVHNSASQGDVDAAQTPSWIGGSVKGLPKAKSGIDVILYQKSAIGIGLHTANPFLQEMPDTLTKVTWDNYITMAPKDMKEGDYKITYDERNGVNLATLKVGKNEITLPVVSLPGQMPGTVGVALGYGRGENGENIGKAAFQTKEYGGYELKEDGNPKPIGANAFPLMAMENGTLSSHLSGATITKTGEEYLIASTQIHNTLMGRNSIVRETTLDIYNKKDKSAYNPDWTLGKLDEEGNHVQAPMEEFDLWDEHPVEDIGHRWVMTIDLNTCFGCGSCLIACQVENNVPVVGKDEVRRGREMHWMRIDRYFSSDDEATVGTNSEEAMEKSKMSRYAALEEASLNPKVVHMPMMCQHCNHAPCETVCPVAATTHSNEGLNQMTYNRCIGTRYCANNCPYKVRRFNWFNYPSYKKFAEVNPAQDDLGRMILNPDVTVRTRGVMEKCSMCVQNIQAGKLQAKMEGRKVVDGDVQSICGDSCPAGAIQFGDWNDLKSKVRKSSEDKRAYQVLEEVGTKPNIWYKVKVRNEDNAALDHIQQEVAHHGGGHGDDHGNGHGNDEHGHKEEAHAHGHNNH